MKIQPEQRISFRTDKSPVMGRILWVVKDHPGPYGTRVGVVFEDAKRFHDYFPQHDAINPYRTLYLEAVESAMIA